MPHKNIKKKQRRTTVPFPWIIYVKSCSLAISQLVSPKSRVHVSPESERTRAESISEEARIVCSYSLVFFFFFTIHIERQKLVCLFSSELESSQDTYIDSSSLFQWHTRNLTETEKKENLTASSVSNHHCYSCRTWGNQCPGTRIRRINKLIRIRESFNSSTTHAHPWSKSFSIFLLMTKRTWHRLATCSMPAIPDKSYFKNSQIETVMKR